MNEILRAVLQHYGLEYDDVIGRSTANATKVKAVCSCIFSKQKIPYHVIAELLKCETSSVGRYVKKGYARHKADIQTIEIILEIK